MTAQLGRWVEIDVPRHDGKGKGSWVGRDEYVRSEIERLRRSGRQRQRDEAEKSDRCTDERWSSWRHPSPSSKHTRRHLVLTCTVRAHASMEYIWLMGNL